MHRHPHHRGAVYWDGLGASVSLACAVHCAALPLAFSLLPSLQLALTSWDPQWQGLAQWLLWTHEAERLVVTSVLLFAAIVLGRGYLVHRARHPLMVGVAAALMMGFGAFGHWHSNDLWHVGLQVLGGLGIAAAHVLNWRSLVGLPAATRGDAISASDDLVAPQAL